MDELVVEAFVEEGLVAQPARLKEGRELEGICHAHWLRSAAVGGAYSPALE